MLRDDWPPFVLTAAEMRALERTAIASGAVTGLDLMERAGQGVVEAILAEWPEIETGARRAVVLCGPGNKGGDGFVVARLLKGRGWAVEVFLYGDPEKLPPDARVNFERWREVGEVRMLSYVERSPEASQMCRILYDDPVDVFVDAMFGIGLRGPTPDHAWLYDMAEHLHGNAPTRWVAVDIPTGLCADSGRLFDLRDVLQVPHSVVSADLTVTFHSLKPGHVLCRGPVWCGRVRVVDIGLDPDEDALASSDDSALHEMLLAAAATADERGDTEPGGGGADLLWSASLEILLLGKHEPGHKFSHGHALILSGPATRTGAARLAARAALRVGAGLVTVGAPADALPEHAARLDAIMLREAGDGTEVAEVLADARINAVCVGPGLGLDDRAAGIVGEVLGRVGFHPTDAPPGEAEPHPTRRSVVLDADALTLLARDPALFARLTPACVLTPHAGEFARLFPDIAARLDAPAVTGPAYSKVDATRAAAARAGCTVLYKGPDTVIADETGRAAIHAAAYDRAAPWLATAGSGDVLAGVIAGLLARGFRPFDAACTAAWLHVEAALEFGPGLIAEDLPEMLPRVFRKLGL